MFKTLLPSPKWIVLVLVALALPAAAQQSPYRSVRGMLTSAEGVALAGHRVVYVPLGGEQSVVSQASRPDGSFVVAAQDGVQLTAVAVITPSGERVELPPSPPLTVSEGARTEVVVPSTTAPADASPEAGEAEVSAAAPAVDVAGKVLDSQGAPVVDYRVLFQVEGGYDVFLSGPTDDSGEYTVAIPSGTLVLPVAVIDPRGRRRELDSPDPIPARSGIRRDVTFDPPRPARELPAPAFKGADRLFISFAEDVPVVENYRGEFRLDYQDADRYDSVAGRVVGAIQLKGLPDVELGARVGLGDGDIQGGPGESGLTDLDIWGKLQLGPRDNGSAYGFGFVTTLPVGEEVPGLGADSLATKFFYTARRPLEWAILSYNAGIQVNQDGTLGGVPVEGEVSPSLGAALIFPTGESFTVVAELYAAGERFKNQDADIRLLGGVNWKIADYWHVRGALAIGLADGAPDLALTAGISFDY